MKRLGLGLLVLLAAPFGAEAADPTKPHPHQGLLAPYPKSPPPTHFTAEEQQALAAGEAVHKQTQGETGGRGLAVFRVNAPPETVWIVIQDFASYPLWIDEVEKCEIYRRNGSQIFVRFVLKAVGMEIEYFIHHDYHPEAGWGTWTLDYTRESDLSDSVGFWRVTEVAPGVSQVEYSVDLKISGWVPGFVRNIIVDNGLEDATEWVKEQAERRVPR